MRDHHRTALRGWMMAVAAMLAGGVRAQTQPGIEELGRTSPEGLTAEQVGVRLTWSPNDAWTASANAREAVARAASLRAQKGRVRDGIELEVTQAWLNARTADQSIISSQQELDSATEAYRVARDLFINGRTTSTTLTDAETELTRSRLDLLNSRADARVARVNLDHALGRDAQVR